MQNSARPERANSPRVRLFRECGEIMKRYANDTQYAMAEIYRFENRFLTNSHPRQSRHGMTKSELRQQLQDALLNTAKPKRRRQKLEAPSLLNEQR
jgi:hypothetical protein